MGINCNKQPRGASHGRLWPTGPTRTGQRLFGAQASLQQDRGHTVPNRLRVQSARTTMPFVNSSTGTHPYAPSTINLRLAAIRRLAYEASDCGLLSPDLAAGIRGVKGARRLGVRVGNWLTADEGKKLINQEDKPQ